METIQSIKKTKNEGLLNPTYGELMKAECEARKNLLHCQEELQTVREALDFADKNWRDASQANFLMASQVQKLKKTVAEVKENHAKHIEDAVREQARQSETWRMAYESVINSRTWRLGKKIKRLFGKK